MTHEWVEQKNKEYHEQFKDYPQALVDEWNRIPEWVKNIIDRCVVDVEIKLFEALAKLNEEPDSFDVHRLVTETDSGSFSVRWYINYDIERSADTDEVLKKISKEFEKLRDMAEKYEEFLEYKDRYLEAEDRIMEFDGDIIITDPCYLSHNMSNDEQRKFECCDISSHGIIGIESNTYYGDWGCTTFVPETKVKLGEFCADAGMVCVADLASVLKFNPKYNDHLEKPWCATWIKNFKGVVRIAIDENKERWPAYIVHVVGYGVNKETGETIEFDTVQTGL